MWKWDTFTVYRVKIDLFQILSFDVHVYACVEKSQRDRRTKRQTDKEMDRESM